MTLFSASGSLSPTSDNDMSRNVRFATPKAQRKASIVPFPKAQPALKALNHWPWTAGSGRDCPGCRRAATNLRRKLGGRRNREQAAHHGAREPRLLPKQHGRNVAASRRRIGVTG